MEQVKDAMYAIMHEQTVVDFAEWYLNSKRVNRIHNPLKNGYMFIEGISGIVLYRKGPWQVELFICQPNVQIPEHIHKDVDSIEVYISGMHMNHSGKAQITLEQGLVDDGNGQCDKAYSQIRVRPGDWHGGFSGPDGGSFISIQQWLNDKEPTHVAWDWGGDTMGKNHDQQIST
jgi:hypothetical protein|tara:strand:- start:4 stop:525 length:522 start_codon:yes stop_codon:yes gene_type:complete